MFSPVSLQQYLRLTQNNRQRAKNRTPNAVKPVSKLVHERFCLYLDSHTLDRFKVFSKVLKIYNESRKMGFKVDTWTFLPVSRKQYLRLTQNNLQSAKNRTENPVKPVSKLKHECFRQYLDSRTLDRFKVFYKGAKNIQREPLNRFQSRHMNFFARI